jgi:uncharacterized protein YicC (UPF0701 family)
MEEVTNEGSESVETSNSASEAEVGENQQPQTVESTPAPAEQIEGATPAGKEDEIPEDFEWDGNVDALPKQLQSRGKGMLQYLHKVTQEASQVKRDAEGFQAIVNHPEFKQFLEWQKQQSNAPVQPSYNQAPASELTEEELLLAQSDPKKFKSLLDGHVSSHLRPVIEQGLSKITAMERELHFMKQEKNIDAFAGQHPDFYKINPVIMKAAIRETRGQSLQAAYDLAKKLESHYLDKANTSISQKVAEKKKAVSASPSGSITPKVVYVDSEADANRVAYENAVLGKRVDVRVKKKSK